MQMPIGISEWPRKYHPRSQFTHWKVHNKQILIYELKHHTQKLQTSGQDDMKFDT